MRNILRNFILTAMLLVVGLMVFVIVASFSLIMYSRSNAVKNEGDFQ